MTLIAATTNDVLVVCYGQSLWAQDPSGTADLPQRIREAGYSTYEVWEVGIGWVQFAKRYQGAVIPQANGAPITVIVFMGGTTDTVVGRTGSQIYTDVTTIWDACSAAGYDIGIHCTLTESTSMDGGANTERESYNTIVLGNSGAFTGVVDLAGHPDLDDNNDTTFFYDGTHYKQAATDTACGLIVAEIDACIQAL